MKIKTRSMAAVRAHKPKLCSCERCRTIRQCLKGIRALIAKSDKLRTAGVW